MGGLRTTCLIDAVTPEVSASHIRVGAVVAFEGLRFRRARFVARQRTRLRQIGLDPAPNDNT